jgi:ATP-dependent helicase Lhr and Lhr-like helicase
MTAPTQGSGPGTAVVDDFHPALRAWFRTRFPAGPTVPQAAAWPRIRSGVDVLVASPTGTGKTLTGFMVAIDAAYRRRLAGTLFAAAGPGTGSTDGPAGPGPRLWGPEVVYVSPLRALAADVHENLQLPLEGTRRAAGELGIELPELTVAVRTGDTSAAERASMRRKPPDLLVTTPESLYLLLTAASSRELLRGVRTVIVDEVHTLARDKRGAHLALSLERLHRLVEAEGRGQRLQRIGLSATQRPLETVARLLSGADGRPLPAIVDCGHRRDLDVAIELPASELEAVASRQQFDDVLDRIAGHVRRRRTTLVFVNTRKMAERVAHQLAERLADDATGASEPGEPWRDETAAPRDAGRDAARDGEVDRTEGFVVAAHHGSLSAARRRLVEARLRAGELRALVATASLELGIDVGPVELVCQIGSPRAIGTFLQRVGRANHHVEGTPAGRLYPLTRDELVECTALLMAVRHGRLDTLVPPVAPLDVLAQQLVAEVAAAGECGTEELFEMTRSAAPYAGLDRGTFDRVVDLVCWGVVTGRGRRGAYLHHDAVHGRLRPRRAARITALTAGGAIPETGDYRVVLDPEGVTVGSVHEDFAVEANIGDVFLLGTHSWRVRQVEVGTVRVSDAGDAAPTVPFWLGEAPARSAELSEEVGRLRETVDAFLSRGDGSGARRTVASAAGVSEQVADQVVAYLEVGRAGLGALPTHRRLVVERFFDESEGMQLVVHSPFGGRVNRAFGLALRKRFCVTFDFELQAAADDDTVVLSLGPQHSFPLSDVPSMVSSRTVEVVLTQAVLLHPMLQARWRWNCNRALVLPRSRGGQRRPIHLQRMEADDLLAATWPALAACQENTAPGPITVPDHVLARQTVADCLSEPLDAEGLVGLLRAVESGAVDVRFVESAEPSVLAHGILTGRPYTFLDGAPLEERRTRAVPLRRGLGTGDAGPLPVAAGELAPFHPDAVAAVLDQVRPRPRDADELHDLLLSLVRCRPVEAWQRWYETLEASGRASVVDGDWVATERRAAASSIADDDGSAAECARGHLDMAGPVTVAELVSEGPLPAGAPRGAPLGEARARTALARLEASGSALQLPDGRWCARHLLVRLYQASRGQRRRAVQPASIADFLRALTRWQHAAPGAGVEGRAGLLAVLEQLQGIEAPAGDWETEILPARVTGYDPRWLDELCLAGEVAWGRLTPRTQAAGPSPSTEPGTWGASGAILDMGPMTDGDGASPVAGASGVSPAGGRRGSAVPSPATPLAIVLREDLGWQLAAVRTGDGPVEPGGGPAADLLAALRRGGACFRSDLAAASRRLPVEVDDGLWDLVARGLVTADAFSAVRTLLSARQRWRTRQRHRPVGRLGMALRRAPVGSGIGEGRWSLLPSAAAVVGSPGDIVSHGDASHGDLGSPLRGEELAEAVAGQLLLRWGVVAWELWARESYRLPWRDVVRALRRLEARGLCLGGRFVAGLSGEQYALEEAAGLLGQMRNRQDDVEFSLAASDPLNLTGLVVPGPRVPATRRRHLHYRDGTLLEERPAG